MKQNNPDDAYPAKEYDKQQYLFTAEETKGITPYYSAMIQGQLMEMHLNQFLHSVVLPRVGAVDSPDMGIAYDFTGGRFTLYVPKKFCAQCKRRKSNFEYKGKNYCEECLDLVKTVEAGKGKVK